MAYSYYHRCGIFGLPGRGQPQPHWEENQYPLIQSACHYTVVDVNVQARLTQVYVSKAFQAEEVKYVFPLPSDAAVCAFSAVVDDKRTIRGVVKKKDEAKRDYDVAIAQGKTAGLLDQHAADVFEVTLGQLKHGQKIAVNISFVCAVSHDGKFDSLRLTLPLSIAPNYGTRPDTLAQFSHLRGGASPFELTMSFSMASNIMSITSQTHPIGITLGLAVADSDSAATFDPTKAHVTLNTSGMLDKDVVIVLKCEGLDRPRSVVERAVRQEGTSDALALTLVPRFDPPPLPAQEYLFLIDRSGSMDGARIAAVCAALQIMLRSLPARGTRINLLSFGSHTTALWPASVEYSSESVRVAAAHVDAMHADYGGTKICAALQMAFESRPEERRGEPTMVLLLTDGESWDVQGVVREIESAVEESKGALRVFVLGVGNQVSTNMCNAIARAGRGVASFVGEQEKPDAKLMNLLKAARSAAVTDISVDWGFPLEPSDDGDEFELVDVPEPTNVAPVAPPPAQPMSLFNSAPVQTQSVEIGPTEYPLPPVARIQQNDTKKIGALYPGFRTNLYAIIQQPSPSAPLPTKVIVSGTALDAPVTLEVSVTVSTSSGDPPINLIHVLAARSFVQELEDKSNKLGLVNALIARLGMTYGIASSQTSFVAVDEQSDVVVPMSPPDNAVRSGSPFATSSALPAVHSGRGRGGTGGVPRGGRVSSQRSPKKRRNEPDSDRAALHRNRWQPRSLDTSTHSADTLRSDNVASASVAPTFDRPQTVSFDLALGTHASRIAPDTPTLELLARQQEFDGSFEPKERYYDFIGAPTATAAMPSDLASLGGLTEDLKATVWCTLVTLAYLDRTFGGDRDAWALLAEKAHDFVLQTLVHNAHLVESQATGFVKQWGEAASGILQRSFV